MAKLQCAGTVGAAASTLGLQFKRNPRGPDLSGIMESVTPGSVAEAEGCEVGHFLFSIQASASRTCPSPR